jgi:serine/threonine protein kinase
MSFHCIHCRSEIEPSYKACPFCGEPITEFLRRYLEAPIDGKYQVLSRLGVGGMAEVYKVLHVHLNAIRVVKLMRPSIASDPTAHDRFSREARLATRLNHPNVATLFDFSTLDDGSRYMVWEYIEGINLQELIEERGPLSPRYAATLAIQALRGLDAIHRAGIVHRDVSPENLMITPGPDGQEHVKVIDLGIAKQWGDDADEKTKTGMFVGKWKYSSPEHLGVLPAGERIDARADIYAFGIVLYEMLTGVAPFVSDSPQGYFTLHTTQTPRALQEANPSVRPSPALEALIRRALQKNRAERFASAREFAHELETILPDLDDQAGARPPQVRLAASTTAMTRAQRNVAPALKPAKRSRGSAFAIIALALAATGAGVTMMKREAIASKPLARRVRSAVTRPTVLTDGTLAINAFPWATVREIRETETGQRVEHEALVTPVAIDLPPGSYEVVLSSPAAPVSIKRAVEITAGQRAIINVQFVDPATLPLPFGEPAS